MEIQVSQHFDALPHFEDLGWGLTLVEKCNQSLLVLWSLLELNLTSHEDGLIHKISEVFLSKSENTKNYGGDL